MSKSEDNIGNINNVVNQLNKLILFCVYPNQNDEIERLFDIIINYKNKTIIKKVKIILLYRYGNYEIIEKLLKNKIYQKLYCGMKQILHYIRLNKYIDIYKIFELFIEHNINNKIYYINYTKYNNSMHPNDINNLNHEIATECYGDMLDCYIQNLTNKITENDLECIELLLINRKNLFGFADDIFEYPTTDQYIYILQIV